MKKKYLFLLFLCFNVSLMYSQVYMYNSINEEEDTLEYSNDTIGEPDIDDKGLLWHKCKIPDCENSWGNKDIKICKNCREGGGVPPCTFPGVFCKPPTGIKLEFTAPIFRVLKFGMLFNQTAIYDISSTGNQTDWNKGPKIYSKESDGDKYYIAIGWRWNLNPPAVELALYGHIDHKSEVVTETGRFAVSLNQYITQAQINMIDNPNTSNIEGDVGWPIELIFSSRGYFVSAGDRGVAIRRDFSNEDYPLPQPGQGHGTWYEKEGTEMRRGAYFGGNEKAPHEIHIQTRDWYADCEPTWWNETKYKGFAYSEWYDGETLTYFASDEIEFNPPPPSFWSQAGKIGYCKINSGADITFISPHFVGETEVYAEVGAHYEHILATTGTNTGEKPVTYICPDGKGLKLRAAADTRDSLAKEMLIKDDKFPETFEIHPNPNNGNMQVAYEIPKNATGDLEIYDMVGKKLLSYPLYEGKNTFSISATMLKEGIYFYRATAGNKLIAKDKIVIIK